MLKKGKTIYKTGEAFAIPTILYTVIKILSVKLQLNLSDNEILAIAMFINALYYGIKNVIKQIWNKRI